MMFHLEKILVMAIFGFVLQSCKDSDSAAVATDELAGVWGFGVCSQLIPDELIFNEGSTAVDGNLLCADPDTDATQQSCVEGWRAYQVQEAYQFTGSSDTKEDDALGVTKGVAIWTRKVFINSTSDVCLDDQIYATEVQTFLYGSGELSDSDIAISSSPKDSKRLDLQLTGATRTYHNDDQGVIAALSADAACTYDDWALDKAKDLIDKDNCDGSVLSLSDEVKNLNSASYFSTEGEWTGEYVKYQGTYSIYKIEVADGIKKLYLGTPKTYADNAERSTVLEAETADGSSAAKRHAEYKDGLNQDEDQTDTTSATIQASR